MSNIAMVAADLTKWIAWGPVTVNKLHGYNNQGVAVYIQLHQVPPLAAGGLTAGAAPVIKSLACAANAPFAFTMPFTLSECLVALSSTEASYTAVAAAGGLDMTVDFDSDFLVDANTTVVGDLTSAVNSLQVWTETNGAANRYALVRLDVIDLSGVQQWITLQGTNAAYTVTPPSGCVLPLAANTTFSGQFGIGGRPQPFLQTAAFVSKTGCTIRVVNNLTTMVSSVGAASIRAIYQTLP